ncbi:hypothetical protein [Alkalihalobacillus sp. AL-G]|uniref:hypothetical protein n=1 Tax=Alkalihalobacillus sp. AL-G TaxID=2926399 RepID=UPI00272C2C4B|nr:hypothetical protein [Alkalihalobacillus sp. AL-G]WLD92544.1 hypothetical protein MOJ78_16215 [Alkalihalobacillus sp. AL-G]
MKVFIGSIIIVILLCIGLWFLLSPSYKKVGKAAKKYKNFWGETQNGNSRENRKETDE